MAYEDIPELVQHCTLALYQKITGESWKARFMKAFSMAREILVRQGHLTAGSDKGPVYKIQLTPSGKKRDMLHQREGSIGKAKSRAFFEMYRQTELDIDSGDGQEMVPVKKREDHDRK